MSIKPRTAILDIDGTLVKHFTLSVTCKPNHKMRLLPKTLEQLEKWEANGYKIILFTGRKESLRTVTEKQLAEVGIFYDQLIMGIGGGERILVNDKKPDGSLTAYCFNVDRNKGIGDINL